ncbi:hypothetical protein ACE6H2_017569 [Prunus campanulata]
MPPRFEREWYIFLDGQRLNIKPALSKLIKHQKNNKRMVEVSVGRLGLFLFLLSGKQYMDRYNTTYK